MRHALFPSLFLLFTILAPAARADDKSASVLDLKSGGPVYSEARSGNVLFRMPANWTRKDDKGMTSLAPPDLPADKRFELRLLPSQESTQTAQQYLDDLLAAMKKQYTILKATEVKASRHPGGWDAVCIELAVDMHSANTHYWAIYVAKAGPKIQTIFYIANDFEVFKKYINDVDGLITHMRLANMIELAPGEGADIPPLTQYLVNQTTDFLEWLVDVPFTQSQHDFLQSAMVQVWQKKDKATIQSVLQIGKLSDQLAQAPADKRALARETALNAALPQWRQQAANDPLAKVLVDAYDAGHKPIAAGEPPLTRQASDALLEAMYFMACQIEGVDATVTPTPAEKDQWAAKLAEQYPKLNDDQRKGIAQMTLMWAALRVGWPDLADAQKQQIKQQFSNYEPVKVIRAQVAQAKQKNFLAEMQRMQRSHETYMMLSNMSHSIHQTNMAIISNIGGNTRYTWEYRPR